jgi:hypothetical protein
MPPCGVKVASLMVQQLGLTLPLLQLVLVASYMPTPAAAAKSAIIAIAAGDNPGVAAVRMPA